MGAPGVKYCYISWRLPSGNEQMSLAGTDFVIFWHFTGESVTSVRKNVFLMVFAFLSDAKPLASYSSETQSSAQRLASVTPQNVPRWGRSYKQPTCMEQKLPLFIWRGFNSTCSVLTRQDSEHPAPLSPSSVTWSGVLHPWGRDGIWTLHRDNPLPPHSNLSPLKLSPHTPPSPTARLEDKEGFCRFRRPFFLSLPGSLVITAVASSYICEEEHLHQAPPVIMTSFFFELARHCGMTLRRWIQRGP